MNKANKEAKRERHKRLYDGQYHSALGRCFFHVGRAFRKCSAFLKPSGKRLSRFVHPLDHMPAPKRLYTQLAIWSIGLLILTSVNVGYAGYQGGRGVGAAYDDLALDIDSSIVSDEEGYIIKIMPLDGEAVYDLNRTEIV